MEFRHPKYYAELRKIYKQAQKLKQQAQPQVVLNKKSIDKDPDVGYRGTDDVTAIHGGHSSARSVQPKATSNTGDAPHMGPRNSAAEILQQRPLKSPARGRNGSCRVMVPSSLNHQAASNEQSTSEQSLKHRGPRSTSNGRASKAFP